MKMEKNLNVHQYWVSLSGREQQQQEDKVVAGGDTQDTTPEGLLLRRGRTPSFHPPHQEQTTR